MKAALKIEMVSQIKFIRIQYTIQQIDRLIKNKGLRLIF